LPLRRFRNHTFAQRIGSLFIQKVTFSKRYASPGGKPLVAKWQSFVATSSTFDDKIDA
jgi:hypothetical protein